MDKITLDNKKLIAEALGADLKNLDKEATICILLEKNKDLEHENKRLKKALNELTKE